MCNQPPTRADAAEIGERWENTEENWEELNRLQTVIIQFEMDASKGQDPINPSHVWVETFPNELKR
jgi:hypothetical protein